MTSAFGVVHKADAAALGPLDDLAGIAATNSSGAKPKKRAGPIVAGKLKAIPSALATTFNTVVPPP